jgi:hypothetical protein
MKITRVELPDGRLLTIEGGDAEGTAKLLVNHYLGQGPAEDALPVPSLSTPASSSGSARSQPEPAINLPSHPVANEEPLAMPVMNFSE